MELLHETFALGPIGIVLAVASWLSLLMAGLAITRPGPFGRIAALVALGLFATAMAAAWAATAGGENAFVLGIDGWQDEVNPTQIVRMPEFQLVRAEVAEHAAALSAVVVVPLLGIALALRLATERTKLLACLLVAAAALPVWATAWAVLLCAWRLAAYSNELPPHTRYDEVLGAFAPIEALRPWVIGLSLGPALAVAAAIVKLKATGSRRMRLIGLTLGALGTAAFLLTRGRAEDARHPLAFDEAERLWNAAEHASIPEAPTSCPVFDGLVITIDGQRISVDGSTSPVPEALLNGKREVWMELHPGRPYDVLAVLVAPADTPAAQVMNVVRLARKTGVRRVLAGTREPSLPVQTRTLGVLERTPRLCAAPFDESDSGRWGDLMK